MIPHEATSRARGRHADRHDFALKLPFVRQPVDRRLQIEDADNLDSPAGEAGHGKHELDLLIGLDGDTGPAAHESTFMHELGHALGLSHGGAVDRQLQAEPPQPHELRVPHRRADEGRQLRVRLLAPGLATLDEEHLDERAGRRPERG